MASLDDKQQILNTVLEWIRQAGKEIGLSDDLPYKDRLDRIFQHAEYVGVPPPHVREAMDRLYYLNVIDAMVRDGEMECIEDPRTGERRYRIPE